MNEIADELLRRIDWHQKRGSNLRELPVTPEEYAEAETQMHVLRDRYPDRWPPKVQWDTVMFMGVRLVKVPAP